MRIPTCNLTPIKFTNKLHIYFFRPDYPLLVRGTLLCSHSRCCGKKNLQYIYVTAGTVCTYDNRGTRPGVEVADFALDRNAKKKSRSVVGNFMRKLFR
jgi:hypothetical protein